MPQFPNRVACVAVDHVEAVSEVADLVRSLRESDFTVVVVCQDQLERTDYATIVLDDPFVIMLEFAASGAFGLWQAAINTISSQLSETRSLLLLSTRLRGRIAQPAAKLLFQCLLARVTEFADVDLWGLTESWVGQYHLPACFLSIGPRAFTHPEWTSFWARVPASSSRVNVASKIEIELTQSLLAQGLRLSAVYPYEALLERAGAAFAALRQTPPSSESERARVAHLRRVRTLQANRTPMEPLNFFWEELLDLGSPFVARELLSRNPHGISTAAYGANRLKEIFDPQPAR
jgi:hypothetical protein